MTYSQIIILQQLGTLDTTIIDYMNVNEIHSNTLNMKQKGYSGMMFWELGFDSPLNSSTSLLRVINSAVK